MSVRLYHRRSSATKEKIQNGLSPSSALRLQALGVCGPRDSKNGMGRQRSQSLFPGSSPFLVGFQGSESSSLNGSLGVPTGRTRSFSGPSNLMEGMLTESEEDHIFRCYARVMYLILGGFAAVAFGLIVYGIKNFSETHYV